LVLELVDMAEDKEVEDNMEDNVEGISVVKGNIYLRLFDVLHIHLCWEDDGKVKECEVLDVVDKLEVDMGAEDKDDVNVLDNSEVSRSNSCR